MVEPKKERERIILDEVYAYQQLFEVLPSERPDFLIKKYNNGIQFGVEITEYFKSDSEARLQRMEGYFAHLIQGGPHKHKDDREVLKVEKVEIRSADGIVKHKDAPVIIQKAPDPSECINDIVSIIKEKDEKLKDQFQKIDHMNLIIKDNSGFIRLADVSEFYFYFFTPETKSIVLNSSFQEIYFISRFKNGEYFIPLKLILLSALFNYFSKYCFTSELGKSIKNESELMTLFAHYLGDLTENLRINCAENKTEIIFGGTGVSAKWNTGITVTDYFDNSVKLFPVFVKNPKILFEQREKFQAYQNENMFTCNIAFSLNTGVPFVGVPLTDL